jgi:hypothetical protein
LGLNEDNFDNRWHKTLNSSPQIAIAIIKATMQAFKQCHSSIKMPPKNV